MRSDMIVMAILLAACADAQELQQTALAASILGKALPRWTGQGDAGASVATALSLAGTPGGIADRERCGELPRVGIGFIAEGLTLEGALIQLKQANPQLTWHVEGRGALRVDLSGDAPSILNVRLRHVRLDARNLDLSIDNLMQTEEVQAAARRAGAELTPPALGFSSLSKGPAVAPPQPDPIELSDVSVEDVLNRVAERNGRAVWEVSEHSCDGVHSIKFQWLVR